MSIARVMGPATRLAVMWRRLCDQASRGISGASGSFVTGYVRSAGPTRRDQLGGTDADDLYCAADEAIRAHHRTRFAGPGDRTGRGVRLPRPERGGQVDDDRIVAGTDSADVRRGADLRSGRAA